jgi:hypothetical protein
MNSSILPPKDCDGRIHVMIVNVGQWDQQYSHWEAQERHRYLFLGHAPAHLYWRYHLMKNKLQLIFLDLPVIKVVVVAIKELVHHSLTPT